jgi:hypothetical protein
MDGTLQVIKDVVEAIRGALTRVGEGSGKVVKWSAENVPHVANLLQASGWLAERLQR